MTDDARDVARDGTGERLSCGAEPASLLVQVCEGRDDQLSEHQTGCPHCQAELVRCRALWSPFDGLAREPARAPRTVVARALTWVREMAGDRPQAARFPMENLPEGGTGPAGESWVSAQVVIRSVRLAAEQVEGVRVALGHLVSAPSEPARRPPGSVTEDGRPAVQVAIAAEYGQDLHALAERIRNRVAAEVRQLTGRAPTTVDVFVDDVLVPSPAPRAQLRV